jgi:hypothetical protein
MGFAFNPFTGNFDQKGSGGGGGASYIDGEVQNFSALPQTIGSPAVDSAYLVREAEGAWLLSRKPAGIYIRTADTGVRADDWTHAGAFPDVFSDANFLLYDNATPSKNLQFQLSGIAAATTRTITMPDANVTLPDQGTSTGDSPTFAKVTINDTVNEQSTLTLSDETHPNKIEFAAEELTLRHTGASDTPYINVTDGTDYALLGVRTGEMFLQGSNAVVRIEKSGGGLADIKVNKLVLEDATSSGEPTATFDADGNLTDNRTYDLPDASGTIALTSQLATGSTDNAILRADGTGGAQTQGSDLVIDDAVVPFSITGDAGTDIITAVGHNYTANQGVRFPTLTGGSGLTAASTNYFVRDISGATFKVSTTSGGSAVNFTTNITAGTVIAVQANVAVRNNSSETNSALVLTPKGNGALIVGPKPDGTITGGNPRGNNAVDLQNVRSGGSGLDVASGNLSVIVGGDRNRASATWSAVVGGNVNQATNNLTFIGGGLENVASGEFGVVGGGYQNTASGYVSAILGGFNGLADRRGLQAHASGQFAARGDAQRIRAVSRCKTTTNAAVEMALDGSTTYLTIPSGKVIFCNIKVVGVKSDGAVVATYERQYAAKNVAGTSSEVFAPVTIGTDNASSTSLEVATVDAGDYIRIRPTGIASETWRWVASVDAVEVAYGT